MSSNYLVLYIIVISSLFSNLLSDELQNTTITPIFITEKTFIPTMLIKSVDVFGFSDKHVKDLVSQLNVSDPTVNYFLENQLKYCPLLSYCNISRGNNFNKFGIGLPCCKECRCTSDCFQKRNCCPDVLLLERNYQVRETCVRPQLKPFNYKGKNLDHSYFMISKCPNSVNNSTDINLCEKVPKFPITLHAFVQHIPATSVLTNVTYRNKYCAFCNGEKEKSVVLWRSSVACLSGASIYPSSILQMLQHLNREEKCNIHFFIPGTKVPSRCDWGLFTQCNQSGNMDFYDPRLEDGCNSFTSIYHYTYRNIMCYMCNKKAEPRMSGCVKDHHIGEFDTASFTALLDFRVLDSEIKSPEVPESLKSISCLAGQRYDEFKNVCREIYCLPGFTYSNGSCKSVYTKQNIRSYEVYLRIENDDNCLPDKACVFKQIMSFIWRRFDKDIEICSMATSVYLDNSTLCRDNTPKIKQILIHLKLFINYQHNIEDIIEAINDLEQYTIVVGNTLCYLDSSVQFHITIGDKLDDDTSVSGKKLLFPFDPSDSNNGNSRTNFRFRGAFSCHRNIRLERIRKNHLCPKISLPKSQYEFLYNKTKTCIESTDICFANGKYSNESDNVVVCSESYFSQISSQAITDISEYQIQKRKPASRRCSTSINNAQNAVSLAFSSLSILCLLIVLVIYSVLKDLRTVPGKNNMALTVNLLIAQILFQFGSGQRQLETGCKILGLLIHLFWLSSLFWMNSCTIHMFRVFAQIRGNIANENSQGVLIKYSVYSYGASACFVLANVVIRLALTEGRDMGYGGCVCYISSKEMVGYTFALPVALIITANIFLFIFVIIRVHNIPKVQSSRKNRNTFLIYIKLSCLTGLTWIFGFIYQWTLLEAFAYLFIVLNAGQGIYIMLAFTCNKRVFNMLKMSCNNCFGKHSQGHHSMLSSSNKTSSGSHVTTETTCSQSKQSTPDESVSDTKF